MGRRLTKSTKSGKYMNPTDQARKEARKKELKKNKRQRELVRAAVLKGKDPCQIIDEMKKIDELEYNVLQPSPLNEKVLQDKRKKLKGTLDRVMQMYAKDDQEKWRELKEHLIQYERNRIDLLSHFEAVRHAQQVCIDEIPLPATNGTINFPGSLTSQIPLPDMPQSHFYPPHHYYMPPHHPLVNPPMPMSILKDTSAYTTVTRPTLAPNKEPPGVPPYPPPNLAELEDLDELHDSGQKSRTIRFADDKENDKDIDIRDKSVDKEKEKEREMEKVKPTTLQQKMLAMAGQDIDQFMREMEVVHKKRETERAQDLNARLSVLDNEDGKLNNKIPANLQQNSASNQSQFPPHMQHPQHPMPPMGIPPPPPMHMRMPPPPPPRIGLRLPPGPPPGMPRMFRPAPPSALPRPQNTTNVFSAAPRLIVRDEQGKTTIEAKPQIRNLAADVTRFLPTSLRVKRDQKPPSVVRQVERNVYMGGQTHFPPAKTTDDAYSAFMAEMKGLLGQYT